MYGEVMSLLLLMMIMLLLLVVLLLLLLVSLFTNNPVSKTRRPVDYHIFQCLGGMSCLYLQCSLGSDFRSNLLPCDLKRGFAAACLLEP